MIAVESSCLLFTNLTGISNTIFWYSAPVFGSRRLYDFVDDNPSVVVMNIDYVNDTSIIRTNPKVTSINGAIEIDITG